jgi:hypothetical protein
VQHPSAILPLYTISTSLSHCDTKLHPRIIGGFSLTRNQPRQRWQCKISCRPLYVAQSLAGLSSCKASASVATQNCRHERVCKLCQSAPRSAGHPVRTEVLNWRSIPTTDPFTPVTRVQGSSLCRYTFIRMHDSIQSKYRASFPSSCTVIFSYLHYYWYVSMHSERPTHVIYMNCWVALNNHNAFNHESRPDGKSTKLGTRKAMSISHWRKGD